MSTSIHRDEKGWIIPVTQADGDAWVAEGKAWAKKWGDAICACGHDAWSESDHQSYHQPTQGGRCRAPYVTCECVEFRPRACEFAGCEKPAQKQAKTLCAEHALKALAKK